MLLDKIAKYLDAGRPEFLYIRDDPRMEIWLIGKEWFPVLVSEIDTHQYLVSWGDLEVEIGDEMRAFHYILRIIQYIRKTKAKD